MTPPHATFLRAKGPAPYQPRAAPWVTGPRNPPSPERATQPPDPPLCRPFRARCGTYQNPRALPWAGMFRTFGAEETQPREFLNHIHQNLNAPIRQGLGSSCPTSSDLLAIIKQEGRA